MDKIYRYYSQNGEDYLLCKFFEFKTEGYFVDVGAFDGVHLSNSYCFELLGWQGVCVEPQHFYQKLCAKNRPASKCIHAACVHDDNISELTIQTDITGLFSGAELDNSQKNISDHYNTISKELAQPKTETVPATTLNAILGKHLPDESEIDFISIDVEGFEKNVLNGLDLDRYAPRILLIETSTDTDQATITEYLNPHGYKFARRVGPNSYYARNNDDIEKLNEIEITCVLEKQIHPLGADFSQQIFLDGKIIFNEMNGNSMLKNYGALETLLQQRNEKVTQLLTTVKNLTNEKNSLKSEIKHLKSEIEQMRNTWTNRFISLLSRITRFLRK